MGSRNLLLYSLFVMVFVWASCSKYHDPAAIHDPRLTNPYCNDPAAVNYNWGFPGVPNNSICFYPVDLFKGTYLFNDSVYQVSTAGYFVSFSVKTLNIYPYSQTKMAVTGFCNFIDTVKFTAGVTYVATTDTLVGDSLTNRGQILCRAVDTITGTITKDRVDSSVLHVAIIVYSDTGATSHVGTAKKQ